MFKFLRKISDDARHFPLGIKLVVFVVFLRSFGWGFVDPFFSIFVDSFSKNYTGVGTLIAVMNFASLLAIIPLARLVDKVQDSVIMRDGEVLYAFSVLFYTLAAFTNNISFLLVAFVLNGLAMPFVIVSAETYIRRHGSRANETKSFAFFTALNYLGWILGMLIAAYTFPYYGYQYMFLFVLPGVMAGFMILKKMREHGLKSIFLGFKKYFHNGQDFQELYQDVRSLNKRTFFLLIISFFDGFIVMFTFVFIPLLALSLGLGAKSIALMMVVMYLPFIFSFLISELTEKLKKMTVIATGLFIGGLSLVLLSMIIDQFWVAILASMNTFSLSILRPAYNGMLTHITPRRMMGGVTGINNMAMRLGFIVGPIVSGAIADRFSIQVAFLSIAVFAFGLSLISLLFRGYETISNDA